MGEVRENSTSEEKAAPRYRVLAGFGSIADELPTIDTAMALARALEADIAGCFVKDVDLLNLAGLPFAKAMRPADRTVLKLEREHMERQISRAAANWERMLHAKASRSSVRCSYKITKGAYSAEIARETEATDIVVVNPLNLPHKPRDAVSLLLREVNEAMGAVIMPERCEWRAGGPIVLLMHDTEADQLVMGLARRIARAVGNEVVILMVDVDEENHRESRDAVAGIFGPDADVRYVRETRFGSVAAELAELQPSLVIVQPSASSPTDAAIELLLKSGRAPLMLVLR
ncbi:hypothetical protein [Hoeflea sp. TYP-13]|uniref:hypothetical protein n=1 Tax=Hoeflea sp. TYP-13 TaxID=3230023 RepID=UPI0034C66036